MKFDILLFAAARDMAGQSLWSLELPEEATVADLKSQLLQDCPNLNSMANILLVAVNNHYAGESHVLTASDTIACFPPVSGG